MKRRQTLFLLLALILMAGSVSLGSCGKKKDKPTTEFTEFEQGLNSQDSVAVRNLVDQFFGYVKKEDFASATSMLYRTDPQNPKAEPQLLNNDEIKAVEQLLRAVPMVDYKIEYMKFSESYRNEVLCSVIIKKGDGKKVPDVKTKMFFKPMRYLGQWCLALMNSEWGDQQVIKVNKRDSMAREYSDELKARKRGR